jgi:bifunctional N-acetylglucosamine-1-phosphate-uridyltransferase/glucosamine-1-phosphate-acetyltransferase GlmU-like protein
MGWGIHSGGSARCALLVLNKRSPQQALRANSTHDARICLHRQRMFSVSLNDKTTIDNQKQLNELFRTDCLFLQEGGSIVLSGDIALGPNVIFGGTNRISGPARIEAGSVLTNVDLGRNSVVRSHSIISNLKAGDNNLFGPFCFIRDDCVVENDVILGAHVEIARSSFGSGVKISHRVFVADASIGRNTIIGAGTVFCNFDGKARQPISVGAEVTVGSGTMLVAPLSIGDNVVIGAGSVVTKDLSSDTKFVQMRQSYTTMRTTLKASA